MGTSQRAERFAMRVPLRYRRTDDMSWWEGCIENISRTGVLFRGEQVFGLDTQVEMRFVLPVEVPGEAAAEVVCHGAIVRTVSSTARETLPGLAASIFDYRIVPGQEAPAA
jgi:PilZ domain-containing protein